MVIYLCSMVAWRHVNWMFELLGYLEKIALNIVCTMKLLQNGLVWNQMNVNYVYCELHCIVSLPHTHGLRALTSVSNVYKHQRMKWRYLKKKNTSIWYLEARMTAHISSQVVMVLLLATVCLFICLFLSRWRSFCEVKLLNPYF